MEPSFKNFLKFFLNKQIKVYFLFKFINPVQFPLHEPYFDLTPIKVMHTKIMPTYLYTKDHVY